MEASPDRIFISYSRTDGQADAVWGTTQKWTKLRLAPSAGILSRRFSPAFLAPLAFAPVSSSGGLPTCRMGTTSPHANQQKQAARPSL
jgi:hypothetical protein